MSRQVLRRVWLVAQAWVALIVCDCALHDGFVRVHDSLRRMPARPRPRARSADGPEVIWAVDEACVWYVKRVPCLQRSVVATWMLRRHGIAAELVIGFRPLPFESHAWVEVDHVIVNDRPQYQQAFTVLERV